MRMTVDILDYIGKHDDGIFVLLSLGYEEQYYEATFYYKDTFIVLTVDESLEEKLGCEIEDWDGYGEVMYDIVKKVTPYEEMIKNIDDFKPEEYGLYLDPGEQPNNGETQSNL
jgi:hypothetical protein